MRTDEMRPPSERSIKLNGSVHPLTVGKNPGSGVLGEVRSHFMSDPVDLPKVNGATFRHTTVVRGTLSSAAFASKSPNVLSPTNSLKSFGHLRAGEISLAGAC